MTNPKLKKAELRDLVKAIYEERTGSPITNKDAEPFIEDVFLAIEEALLDGYDVPVGKIGTLKVKQREARKGLNPAKLKELKAQGVSDEDAKAQAQIDIAESKSVGFTQSKTMKDAFKEQA